MLTPVVIFQFGPDRCVPDSHGGYCDKHVPPGQLSRNHWIYGKRLCPNDGIAKIIWRNEKSSMVQYYCRDHINGILKHVFEDGIVNLLNTADNTVVKKRIDEVIHDTARLCELH